MSNKLVDNKRRSHADKVLQAMSKKAGQPGSPTASSTSEKAEKKISVIDPLKEQYEVIREDILKLREDLSKGFDLAKSTIEKKGLISELLKSR
jgi:hypothetical protein